MKKIVYSVAIVSLFFIGCGGDRSQDDISSLGKDARWIYDTDSGKKMVENNFVYIPGGFDVDGDGVDEGGFWLSKYEARDGGVADQSINIDKSMIAKSFKLYDPVSKKFDKDFNENIFTDVNGFTQKVVFNDKESVINNTTPTESVTILQNSQIDGGVPFSLISEKQWKQLVELITKNPKNWSGGEVGKGELYKGVTKDKEGRRYFVISNSLFETSDSYVPKDYSIKIYDLSGNYAEWTNGVAKLSVESNNPWANSDVNAGGYKPLSLDSFAVVARGGSKYDDSGFTGINARKEYKLDGRDISVSFRGASEYLY